MRAGVELDAEVARVLSVAPFVAYHHKYREPQPSDMWVTAVVDMGERRETYLNYSTDMTCAWRLVEKMKARGSFELNWAGGNGWFCRTDVAEDSVGHWADTAPLAICKCFLHAFRV